MRRLLPLVSCLAVLTCADVCLQAADTNQRRQTLDKLVSIKAEDATLREIVELLAKQAGAEIGIDEPAVSAELDIDADPLTVNLKNLPLRSVFKFLADGELSLQSSDGHLVVSTLEDEVDLETQFFDVLDLIREDETTAPSDYDYKTVTELITWTIEPETWDEVGGWGRVRPIRGLLMVQNQQHVSDQIPKLLSGFRKARKLAQGDDRTTVSVPLADSPTEPVNRALARPFDLDFENVPLAEVTARLQDAYGVSVVLSPKGVRLGVVDPRGPVSVAGEMQPLHQALSQLVEAMKLEWYVRDGAIVIGESDYYLETRAYPVKDLLGEFLIGDEFDGERREFDYEDLIDLTTSVVAPETWELVGGAGAMTPLPEHGLLLVSQSWLNHRAVEGFLTAVRKELADRPRVAEKPAKKHAEQMRLAVYVFATPDLEEQRREEEAEKRKPVAPSDDLPPGEPERDMPIDPFGGDDGDPFGGGGGDDEFDPFAPGGDAEADPFGPGGFGGGGLGGSSGASTDPRPFYSRELPITEVQLVEIITGVIEPTSWANHEGAFISAAHGRIVVRHTNAVHEKIEKLAKRLQIKQFREVFPPDYKFGGFGSGLDGGGFF